MAGSDHEDGPAGHKLKKTGTFSMAASRLSLFNNPLKTHDEEDDEHLIGSGGDHQHHHSSSVESANLKPVDDDEESPLQFSKVRLESSLCCTIGAAHEPFDIAKLNENDRGLTMR